MSVSPLFDRFARLGPVTARAFAGLVLVLSLAGCGGEVGAVAGIDDEDEGVPANAMSPVFGEINDARVFIDILALRWDEDGIWTVVVWAQFAERVPWIGEAFARFILAGDTLGAATLSRFYAFHVFFFPALITVFIGVHLYLVLYHGISEPPEAGRTVNPRTYPAYYEKLLEQGKPYWPYGVWREGVAAAVVIVVRSDGRIFFTDPPYGIKEERRAAGRDEIEPELPFNGVYTIAAQGSLALLMVQHLTGGNWGMSIRRIAEALGRHLAREHADHPPPANDNRPRDE